jgi:hypothetical protein
MKQKLKTLTHSYHKTVGTITRLIPLDDTFICHGFQDASLTVHKRDVHQQEITFVNMPDLFFPKIADRIEKGATYLLGATNDKSYGPIPKIIIIDLKYVYTVEYFGENETSYYFKVSYFREFNDRDIKNIKTVLLSDVAAI